VIPTIASFPLHHGLAATENHGARPLKNSRPMLSITLAFAAVAIIAGLVLAVRYSLHSPSNPEGVLTEVNNSPSPNSVPNPSTTNDPTSTVPTTRSSPLDDKRANSLEADPALFPKPATNQQSAPPTASSSVDYSGIFSGRDVTSKARILDKPEPTYTALARKNQIKGTIVLRVVFSSDGTVTNIHAVSALPDGLTEQAIEAAKKIRFVPATKDGHPVSMWMELQYNFNLY
jgi:TonB family protein